MSPITHLILLTLSLTFQAAQPWTIDLPEVRQYYFAKYGHVPPKSEAGKDPFKEGEFIYNNYYSNTPFAEGNPGYVGPVDRHAPGYKGEDEDHEVMKGGQYADDYEYQSYMEKKVNHIVSSGARYLEGLRRAVDEYTRRLENCTTTNYTTLVSSGSYESCNEATQKSEHVRRVAQLALHTTKLLQDREDDPHRDPREEKALLLRLATFLDTLTHLTGFEPNPKAYLTTSAPESPATNPLGPPASGQTSDEAKRRLMACLDNAANSSEPATERCKTDLPQQIKDFFDLPDPDSSSPSSDDSMTVTPRQKRSAPQVLVSKIPSVQPSQSGDSIRVAISKILHGKKQVLNNNPKEDRHTNAKADAASKRLPVPAVNKSPKLVQDAEEEAIPQKEQNPMLAFVNYYAKFKAWSNENPEVEGGRVEFRDENHLNRLQRLEKRSVDFQKGSDQPAHLPAVHRVPEDPMQDISAYIKHRSQDYLNPDKDQADRIRQYIEGVAGRVRRTKRSVRPYGFFRPYRPRVPEDPLQDISYYVKHREGTDIRPDPVQAAQVRLGLEQIFQTGQLPVVQRYGSNYNPAVPDQINAGLLQSIADA